MTSMNMLRQEAAAIGITDAEARKYGDLRHKRTWSLAIEHHLSMQGEADRTQSSFTTSESDSSTTLNHSQAEELKDYGIALTANLGESGVKIENQTASFASPQQQEIAILFVGAAPVGAGFPSDRFANANGRSYSNFDHRSNQNRSFKQVVHNHIKALTIASPSGTNQSNYWVCPECGPEGELSCHLCTGEGNVGNIAAISWTVAYMEMLGCSAREIEPFRRFPVASETLELNLKVCVAIKKSSEVLARTEKWVIGNR